MLQVSNTGIQDFLNNTVYTVHNPTVRQKLLYSKTMHLVFNKMLREDIPFDEFQDIPRSYWRKAIGTQYIPYLNKIVELGGIERNDSYSNVLR